MMKHEQIFQGEILDVMPDKENFHVLIKIISGDPFEVVSFQSNDSTKRWQIVGRMWPSLKLWNEKKVQFLISPEATDSIPKKGEIFVGLSRS